jgi:hypothetical protein
MHLARDTFAIYDIHLVEQFLAHSICCMANLFVAVTFAILGAMFIIFFEVHKEFCCVEPLRLHPCMDRKPFIGGGRHGKISGDLIHEHFHNSHGLEGLKSGSFSFKLQCRVDDIDAALSKSAFYVSVTTPLRTSLPYLPPAKIGMVAKLHGVRMNSRPAFSKSCTPIRSGSNAWGDFMCGLVCIKIIKYQASNKY